MESQDLVALTKNWDLSKPSLFNLRQIQDAIEWLVKVRESTPALNKRLNAVVREIPEAQKELQENPGLQESQERHTKPKDAFENSLREAPQPHGSTHQLSLESACAAMARRGDTGLHR